MREPIRRLPGRFSEWVAAHPIVWGLSSAVVLVLAGFALEPAPIVLIAAGAAIGVLNILHAKRRGYCPVPQSGGLIRHEQSPTNRSGSADD